MFIVPLLMLLKSHSMKKINFNEPVSIGNPIHFIKKSLSSMKISGDGFFTKKCNEFFINQFNFRNPLLTSSCTDALEMASILIDIKYGDEIIAPSFTFVSTVNPFLMRGAKIRFIDSQSVHPNIDADLIEEQISKNTKAIVIVHYAGVSCEIDKIINLAKKYNLFLIEDCAHALCASFNGVLLGSFGDISVFSFHETKNISCGEGGLFLTNRDSFFRRAEIIREKGTNRSAFFRNEVPKYNWVDIGSSFLPSDFTASLLYSQLISIKKIQSRRISLFNRYLTNFTQLPSNYGVSLPYIPSYASNNAHMFYIICKSFNERSKLIKFLNFKNIYPASHYLPLHLSPFFSNKHDGRSLKNSVRFSDCLLRLPLHLNLKIKDIDYISKEIINFYIKEN